MLVQGFGGLYSGSLWYIPFNVYPKIQAVSNDKWVFNAERNPFNQSIKLTLDLLLTALGQLYHVLN